MLDLQQILRDGRVYIKGDVLTKMGKWSGINLYIAL
jgi:hypothetical protein